MERPTFRKAVDSVKSHTREVVGGVALLTLAAAACKGGQGQEVGTTPTQPANTPNPTETIAPTSTPSPELTSASEPTKPPIKKLSEAEIVPTDYQTLYDSLLDPQKGALVLHPDYTQIYFRDSEVPLSREYFTNNLEFCKNGNPTERTQGCEKLTLFSYYLYSEKGWEEFYDVAVNAANYHNATNSGNQAKFDELLSQNIQQTSPSSAK